MKEGGGRILHSLYTCDVESAHSLERMVNAQYAKRGNKVSVAFSRIFLAKYECKMYLKSTRLQGKYSLSTIF